MSPLPRRTAQARFDCHVHSQYSPDGRGALHELAAVARAKGLTGFCVTDHNSLRMAQDIRDARIFDLLIVPGQEMSTIEGHCLALGVRAEVPARQSLAATVEAIVAAGGVAVPSHPFRRIHGVGADAIRPLASRLKALETYNARDGRNPSNARTLELALAHHLGGTGGSDAHQIFEVGNAYAAFPDPVNTVDDFLDQIGRGRTWGEGVPTPRRKLLLQNVKNLWLYARRGFKGI